MNERIENQMKTLKLGGLAKEWQAVQFENTVQNIGALLELELREREVNRITAW